VIAELLAFVAVVVAVAAPVCGHQTQPWPLRGAWRALTAAHRASRDSRATGRPFRAAQRRTAIPARRTPAWAHTQPQDKEHA
jgi:hypothetical protein